ncbi:MAG TPA: hypothetical protein EYO33_13910 [Phycisphaerales bacterium]|nr:hypothetical protein [Phycisphaerales bacterium]
MPSNTTSVGASTAVLEYDILTGERHSRQPYDRAITGIGLAGSAAIGDTELEVFVDTVLVGTFFNTSLGFPNKDDMIDQEAIGVPAGAQLQALVRDAPASNPINIRIDALRV